jgi:hypothetical protein
MRRTLVATLICGSLTLCHVACAPGEIDDALSSAQPDDGAAYARAVASLGAPVPVDEQVADGAALLPVDVIAPDATAVFRHPGVLVDKAQLDFVKAKIQAGAQPWTAAFQQAKASRFAAATYQPSAIATVVCGPYSNPDVGCSAEKSDAIAAYTNALLWYYTGNAAYANKAIAIMNAWSSTLKAHTNHNAPLQSAWVGDVISRAAEIIRWTYSGWAAADVQRYATMLRTIYLPEVIHGDPGANGNWELSMTAATLGIGVFLDDKSVFDQGVAMWKKRVPAYIYLTSDGKTPVPPPGTNMSGSALTQYWFGQTTLVDGVGQETCRDFGHLQLGFAGMINAAETARIQGVDLYGAEAIRITAGLEFNAQFLDGVKPPSWLCKGKPNLSYNPTWEIAYNEYANRLGKSLPHVNGVIGHVRPTGATHHMVWETLTHAELGSVGIP